MVIDFKKLEEFNAKYPNINIPIQYFLLFNMLVSEDVNEDTIKNFIQQNNSLKENVYRYLETLGIIKIIGDGYKDISIRPLGIELIGENVVDNILETASKIRELFPKGVKSGGKLVKSAEGDIANKLRKFFKKYKYSQEQVLQATKNYVESKRKEGWSFMQTAAYFIEKDGVSNLAAECDNLNTSEEVTVDIMKRL